MKNTWIAGIAGALCGALASWLVAPRAPDTQIPVELSVAVGELREAVSLLRASLEGRPPERAALAGTRPAQAPTSTGGVAGQPAAEIGPPRVPVPLPAPDAAPLRGHPARTLLPAPDRERVRALAAWKAIRGLDDTREEETGPNVRRQWLFATEAEVLEAFGAPDEVSGGADNEVWHYYVPGKDEDGDAVQHTVTLTLWNGRLRRVD
jgi:hypothetical protein